MTLSPTLIGQNQVWESWLVESSESAVGTYPVVLGKPPEFPRGIFGLYADSSISVGKDLVPHRWIFNVIGFELQQMWLLVDQAGTEVAAITAFECHMLEK
ncbi:hypothetical protein ACFX1X_001056 [Malus domestica]